jgi:hypothetical protein
MDEMDSLTDLKTALRPADGPSDGLRARALAGITGEASHPSTRRRWIVPALGATGVAALASSLLLGGPTTTAAFAVQANPDGSVTFTAHDTVDPTAATRALNQAGISGRVINDITPGCPTRADDITLTDLYTDNTIGRGLGTSDSVTLRSTDYPAAGGLLIVVTSHGEDSGRPVPPDPASVAIFAFDDATKIPTCVDFADPGTGPVDGRTR